MSKLDVIVWSIHVVLTGYFVGMIWFVQLVQYPLFEKLDAERFYAVHRHHKSGMNWLVPVPMFLEGFTALYLVVRPFPVESRWIFLAGLLLVGVNLASTFFIQVPAHNRLQKTFERETCRYLVRSNWIRTISWTSRGGLLIYIMMIAR